MDLVTSMLSIFKSVNCTDREYKLIKQKLDFGIRKAEVLLDRSREDNVPEFMTTHLANRLADAREHLKAIQHLLCSSSTPQSISLKQKIILSLPFNNFKETVNLVIEDLRQATEEIVNNPLPVQEDIKAKKKLPRPDSYEQISEKQVPNQPQNIEYVMGPTIEQKNVLDFAFELNKKQSISLVIEIMGVETILKLFDKSRLITVVEKSRDRNDPQESIELYNLGRMSFKNEYGELKKIYKDIDKISKLSHFKIFWKKQTSGMVGGTNQEEKKQETLVKQPQGSAPSQEKGETHDQFFSIPETVNNNSELGHIFLGKQQRILYRVICQQWVKVQQTQFELSNGQRIAIALNPTTSQPQLYFKVTYNSN